MPTAKKQQSKKTTVKKTTRRTTTHRVVRDTAPATTASISRPMIDPVMAVKRFWTGFFDFMGRSTRSEFWFGLLFVVIVNWLFGHFVGGIVATIVNAILFIPMMALTVRRFRDAGISVWWYLIPVLLIYLIPLIRGAAWYRLLALEYVSSGMLMYTAFFLVFAIFVLVVGCIPSRR